VWFVGVTPRRNPELVVAVLFQNGDKSWFAARIGAGVVAAYVEKQRRLAHNLQPLKAATPTKPVEVGAVWTSPEPGGKDAGGGQSARIHTGHFFVGPANDGGSPPPRSFPGPSAFGLALPTRRIPLP
jgi:penicillin-binding protein 2